MAFQHARVVPWQKCYARNLLERSDGAGFVVGNVEDGVQLGELQQIVDLLGQLEKLELSRPGSWQWCMRSPVRPDPSYRCS